MWLAFFRDLVARALIGVALVTNDAYCGLVEAIGATLPGASWQRLSVKIAGGGMAPLVHLHGRERTWQRDLRGQAAKYEFAYDPATTASVADGEVEAWSFATVQLRLNAPSPLGSVFP